MIFGESSGSRRKTCHVNALSSESQWDEMASDPY